MKKWKTGKFNNTEETYENKLRKNEEVEILKKNYSTNNNVVMQKRKSGKFNQIIDNAVKTFKGYSLKKKVIIVVIWIIFIICFSNIEGNVDEEFKVVNDLVKVEMNTADKEKLGKASQTIIRKDKREYTEKLLEILKEEDTTDEARVTVLSKFSSSHREADDYYKLMTFFDTDNEQLINKLVLMMNRNGKAENEEVFLKLADNYKDNQETLMKIYATYSKRSVGRKDNIYKLEIEPNAIIHSYVYNDLPDKELRELIKNNNDEKKVNDSLVSIGKKIIEEKNPDEVKKYAKAIKILREENILIDDKKISQYENM